MTSKEFKNTFNEIARENGFEKAFSGWFKESQECIAVLELQKSKYGDNYLLNIKIFIHGVFGVTYSLNKDLIKSPMGDITAGATKEYCDIFYFDEPTDETTKKDILKKYGDSFHFIEPITDDAKRVEKLKKLFQDYINPFVNKTLSKAGIREMTAKGEIKLLPAIQEELNKL